MSEITVDLQQFDAGAWRTRFTAVANIAALTHTEAVALTLPEPWYAEVDCSWRAMSGQTVYEIASVDRDRTYSFLTLLAHIKGDHNAEHQSR